MKRVILWLCLSVVIGAVQAQTGRLDLKLPQGHPRYLTTQEGKKETQELIKKAPWAKDVYERLRQRTDKYVDRGTDWLSSPFADVLEHTCHRCIYKKVSTTTMPEVRRHRFQQWYLPEHAAMPPITNVLDWRTWSLIRKMPEECIWPTVSWKVILTNG